MHRNKEWSVCWRTEREHKASKKQNPKKTTEQVGFEPTEGLHPLRFSRPLPSAARPLLPRCLLGLLRMLLPPGPYAPKQPGG